MKLLALSFLGLFIGTRSASAADASPDLPAACRPYIEAKARPKGPPVSDDTIPRLTASAEVNDLVREYWNINDDVIGASQVASLYGGFYGATNFSGHSGGLLAGPILAVRVSFYTPKNRSALVRATQKKKRLELYGIPDVIRTLANQKRDVRLAIDSLARQLNSDTDTDESGDTSSIAPKSWQTPPSAPKSIASRAQDLYENDSRVYAKRQLEKNCIDWINLTEAEQMTAAWSEQLDVELSNAAPPSPLLSVFLPTSFQFGIGFGFRVGPRLASQPETVATGHIGLMSAAGQGAFGYGVALGQDGYVGLYLSVGTDLGIHK